MGEKCYIIIIIMDEKQSLKNLTEKYPNAVYIKNEPETNIEQFFGIDTRDFLTLYKEKCTDKKSQLFLSQVKHEREEQEEIEREKRAEEAKKRRDDKKEKSGNREGEKEEAKIEKKEEAKEREDDKKEKSGDREGEKEKADIGGKEEANRYKEGGRRESEKEETIKKRDIEKTKLQKEKRRLKYLREKLFTAHIRFPCPFCPKSFASERNLRKHSALHEKKLECPTCVRCFSSERTLKAHVRTHEGGKKYSCTACDKHFVSKSGYYFHREAKHRGELGYVEEERGGEESEIVLQCFELDRRELCGGE